MNQRLMGPKAPVSFPGKEVVAGPETLWVVGRGWQSWPSTIPLTPQGWSCWTWPQGPSCRGSASWRGRPSSLWGLTRAPSAPSRPGSERFRGGPASQCQTQQPPGAGWALAVPALPQGPQGGPGARTGCAHRSGAAPHLTLSPWLPARHGCAGRFPDFPSRGAQLVPDAGGTHPRWPRGPCPHGWCLWGGTRRAQPDPWPLSGKAQGEWEEEPRAAADAVCRSAPCPSSCRRAPAAPGSALGWPMAPAAPRTPSPHCQGWSQHHPRGLWDRAGGGGGDSSHRRSVTSQTPGGSRPGWCFSNFYFKSHH